MRESDRYKTVLTRRLAAARELELDAERGVDSLRERRVHHARRTPPNARAGPSSRPIFDALSPASNLLVSGATDLDSASTALFWCSELSRVEGVALAANRHAAFVHQELTKALERCSKAPTAQGPSPKRARLTGPLPADGDKGKGRADDEVSGKGKGRAEPVTSPEDELESGDSDDGEYEDEGAEGDEDGDGDDDDDDAVRESDSGEPPAASSSAEAEGQA